jgi:hypothetical protein
MTQPNQPSIEDLLFRQRGSPPVEAQPDLAEVISAWYRQALARALQTAKGRQSTTVAASPEQSSSEG